MSAIPLLLAIILSPLIVGIIHRVKALFAGRRGRPLLQEYFDLVKLLKKGAVYSETTSWVFRAGPMIVLTCMLGAGALVPFGGIPSLRSFPGDLILFAYLLTLARFFMVAAALDTGSAFEGMGASREAFFSALIEPTLFLGLAAVARRTVEEPAVSLAAISKGVTVTRWAEFDILMLLVAIAFVVIYLAENSRIPVDDPNTHLELTMIHEVMVLDHSGPDLAFIQYSAALKLWVLGAIVVGIAAPKTGNVSVDLAISLFGMVVLAILVGIVESVMARLRMSRVPQLLIGAGALTVLALSLGLAR